MSSQQRTIPAMSIEQMFEDIPNSSFANPHMLSNKLSSEPSTEADQKDEVGKLHGKSHHGGMQKSARQAKSRNKVVKSGSEVGAPPEETCSVHVSCNFYVGLRDEINNGGKLFQCVVIRKKTNGSCLKRVLSPCIFFYILFFLYIF